IEKIYTSLITAVKNGEIPQSRIDDSVRRIIETKFRYKIAAYNEEGMIESPEFIPNKDEIEILKKGEGVNREISQKSICCRGDRALVSPPEETVRIFAANAPGFTAHLSLDKNDIVVSGIQEAEAAINKIPAGKEAVLYFYSYSAAGVEGVFSFCKKKGIPLAAAVSGDPFPLLRSGSYDLLLMSFSNTSASLEFLAKACSGVFLPPFETKLMRGNTQNE
ncbi:MAG: hypothetical protein LBT84_02280, partial [Spirochaetia bacterium]|nr:hypothetical protein [Spirochaetia bacterium]